MNKITCGKRLLSSVALISLLPMFGSCYFAYRGVPVSEHGGEGVCRIISVDEFSGLVVKGADDMTFYFTDAEPYVEVIAQDSIVNNLTLYVNNQGNLTYELPDRFRSHKPITFNVYGHKVEAVTMAGSGDVQLPDMISDSFNITLAGSGYIEMGDLSTSTLAISIAGSGDVELGNVDCGDADCLISVSGSGSVEMDSLKSGELTVKVAGSGDIDAGNILCDNVKVSISGSGEFTAAGRARSFNKRVSGSGSVNIDDLLIDNLK